MLTENIIVRFSSETKHDFVIMYKWLMARASGITFVEQVW